MGGWVCSAEWMVWTATLSSLAFIISATLAADLGSCRRCACRHLFWQDSALVRFDYGEGSVDGSAIFMFSMNEFF